MQWPHRTTQSGEEQLTGWLSANGSRPDGCDERPRGFHPSWSLARSKPGVETVPLVGALVPLASDSGASVALGTLASSSSFSPVSVRASIHSANCLAFIPTWTGATECQAQPAGSAR